ncbi:hypothetical protein CYLTODRAFT_424062 [Cylindrobasidium torrendii FP15055 ss-10]|uniref:Uncharacterized protein n=1 Tax=Cylindrobasidium torrendii FP15055 ss-10 TaxID=1314674 RepID=A0A0D7B5D3_9AGAR|nr:hypothetical protein CYLTODRAFT_424062 [Cylindrobasidium torrendii FP15055 ss-10]
MTASTKYAASLVVDAGLWPSPTPYSVARKNFQTHQRQNHFGSEHAKTIVLPRHFTHPLSTPPTQHA